ncbi:MAG: hypothetical protein JWL83_4749 [Actinomycetia bacterium]|jgi:uncharacterized protein (TIGR03118 family)|nr:hypothetical protein [Actinomycetes bacterium]
MRDRTLVSRVRLPIAIMASALALTFATAGGASAHGTNAYRQTNWVSDQSGHALLKDTNLVNAWGLALSPSSPLWVANNGTNTSTLYTGGNGTVAPSIVPLVVKIPVDAPTGAVFNPTKDFFVHSGTAKAAALFIFATESGSIVGWAPTVPAGTGPSTMSEVARTVPGAAYKGLAISHSTMGNFLYATNFATGAVDVFDHSYKPVHMPGAFVDHNIPAGYRPFGIENIGGRIYVTYALRNPATGDDVKGPGNGFVDVFDPAGHLLKRLASHGTLNAPWGLALAPSNFGQFPGALLVGNFGDGRISAYNPQTNAFLGQLHDSGGAHALAIDGLWGLKFGNGTAGTTNSLLFSAGPSEEAHGLVGAITPR